MYNTSDHSHTRTADAATGPEGSPCLGAIILAGGRGKRLSADKGCLLVGDRPIVSRVVAAAQAVTGQILVVGTAPLPADLNVPVIADEGPDPGPVRGLATGLRALDAPHAFLLAWDMPFLEPALLQYMVGLVDNYDAVVPRIAGRSQPLCALYAQACLARIGACSPRSAEATGSRGRRGPSMTCLLEHLNVRWVEEHELLAFGDPERLFLNVNTPEDLARAREMAQP